jgi:hypothetical protein
MGGTRLEQVAHLPKKKGHAGKSGALNGTLPAEIADLANRLASLPADVRQQILAAVNKPCGRPRKAK